MTQSLSLELYLADIKQTRSSGQPDIIHGGVEYRLAMRHVAAEFLHAGWQRDVAGIDPELAAMADVKVIARRDAGRGDVLFPLLFESLTAELSGAGGTPNSEYPQVQAQELFNAGWAAAAVYDVNPDFSDDYSQALLIGIHKDGKADAYIMFLYSEYSQTRVFIKGALSSLSLAPWSRDLCCGADGR